LTESDRAAIRAFLRWRGWSDSAANAKIDEYQSDRDNPFGESRASSEEPNAAR
jgi:hypothetical protein